MAITAIIAIGMVQIIIATHIDLSVGATVALSGGIIAILTVNYNVSPIIAVLIAFTVSSMTFLLGLLHSTNMSDLI